MGQYLYIPFLGGWTSINPSYFEVHQGYQGFDTLPHFNPADDPDQPLVVSGTPRPKTWPSRIWIWIMWSWEAMNNGELCVVWFMDEPRMMMNSWLQKPGFITFYYLVHWVYNLVYLVYKLIYNLISCVDGFLGYATVYGNHNGLAKRIWGFHEIYSWFLILSQWWCYMDELSKKWWMKHERMGDSSNVMGI